MVQDRNDAALKEVEDGGETVKNKVDLFESQDGPDSSQLVTSAKKRKLNVGEYTVEIQVLDTRVKSMSSFTDFGKASL